METKTIASPAILKASAGLLLSVSLLAMTAHNAHAQQSATQLDTITVQGGEPAPAATAAPEEAPAPAAAESAWGPVDGLVATRSATGTKTDTPILTTPQSVSVVTADQVEQQGAQSVSEALAYTPGLFVQPQGESSRFDETRIRGFQAVQYLDGLRLPFNQFWSQPSIDPYGLERIEVLKGPSSSLYGYNAPGGLINMVSKRPTKEKFGEVVFETGTNSLLQGGFDLGGAVKENERFQYRLTGLLRDSETEVDFTKDDRFFIAPALTWTPTADTSITFLSNYGKDEGNYPQQYLPAQGTLLPNPNGRIPRSRFAGEPGFDDFEREQWWVGYALDHRVNDVWSVRQNLRYMHVDLDMDSMRGEGLVPGSLTTVNRTAFYSQAASGLFAVDNQAQANFGTGPLEHTLLLGLDYQREAGDLKFEFSAAPALNIYNPVYGMAVPPPQGVFQNNEQTLTQTGVYLQDQIEHGRWNLILSGRYDWAETDTFNLVTSTRTVQKDEDFTGRAGLSYLFDNGIAPYVAYATSFQPQSGTDALGNTFSATTGTQMEAGVKYQPPGTNALLTLSLFDIEQEDYVTFDPATFLGVQSGVVEVRGFEAEYKGDLTRNLEAIFSYAYLDSAITKSVDPDEIGRPFPMAPEHQASAWLYYTFGEGRLDGISVGGGVRYVGENFSEVSTDTPFLVEDYTLFDATVRYDLGKANPDLEGVELAVNATNLFNEYYLTYCSNSDFGNTYCSLGAGRTVTASVTKRW